MIPDLIMIDALQQLLVRNQKRIEELEAEGKHRCEVIESLRDRVRELEECERNSPLNANNNVQGLNLYQQAAVDMQMLRGQK